MSQQGLRSWAPETLIFAAVTTLHHELRNADKKLASQGAVQALKDRKTICGAFNLLVNNRYGLLGPIIGASASVLVAEEMIRAGVRRIVFCGLVGGLVNKRLDFAIGDIVFPRGAFVEEGTSRLYGADSFVDFKLGTLQRALENEFNPSSEPQSSIHYGKLWTSDAPNLETPEKIDYYLSRGAIAVEMEFSAIAYLCQIRQIEFAAIFVISDLLKGDQSVRGFKSKILKEQVKTISNKTLKTILETV